jgi:hypothetical protein
VGFLTSYIIITILGVLSHKLYHTIRPNHKGFIAYYSFFSIFGILLIDVLIYLGVFDFILPMLNQLPWIAADPIPDGKDLMWNSLRLIGINFNIIHQSGLNSIAVVLFLSYAPWFSMMKDGSRMLFGQKSYQEGYSWALKPLKKPKTQKI